MLFPPDSLTKLQQKIPGAREKKMILAAPLKLILVNEKTSERKDAFLRLLLHGLAELAKQDNLFYAICEEGVQDFCRSNACKTVVTDF